MASLNSLQIIGRIGSEPEFKEFDKASVLNWSVAVQLYNQEEPTWVRCALWASNDNDTAIKRQDAAAEYLHKGALVFVSGIASASAYENKDQEIVAVLELRVNDWQKLSYDDDGQNGDYEEGDEDEEEEQEPKASGRSSASRSSARTSTSRTSRTSTSSRGSSSRGTSGKRRQEEKPREKTASRTARENSARDIPF